MCTFRSALEVVVERADGAATGAHRQQDEAPVSGEYEPNTSLLRVVLSAYNNNNNQHLISSPLQYMLPHVLVYHKHYQFLQCFWVNDMHVHVHGVKPCAGVNNSDT